MEKPELEHVPCSLCGTSDNRPVRALNGFNLVRCAKCRHVYVNPRLGDAALDRLYTNKPVESSIALYSKIASPSVLREYNRTLDCLEALLPHRGRLLDYACAAGYFFELAQQRGWEAHGVDIGEWTQHAAEQRGLSNLHVGRLAELGFPSGHFDVVYAAQVLEHLTEPRADLLELRRILRPGGLLYVDVPNYRTLPGLFGCDDFVLNMPPQHINYFTPGALYRLVASAGFEHVRITSGGGLKWENLMGRPVRSEIAEAYGLGAGKVCKHEGGNDTAPSGPILGLARSLRAGIVGAIVKPIFYDTLKVGMNLVAVARRPRSE